jgi:type IV secretory pathway VirB10-like protein
LMNPPGSVSRVSVREPSNYEKVDRCIVYIILALIKRKDAGESHTNFTSPRKNTTLSSRRSFFLPPIADNRAASDSRDNKQPAANDDSNSKQRAASDDSDHKQRAANRASDDSDSKQPSRKQADKQTAASSREPSNEPIVTSLLLDPTLRSLFVVPDAFTIRGFLRS